MLPLSDSTLFNLYSGFNHWDLLRSEWVVVLVGSGEGCAYLPLWQKFKKSLFITYSVEAFTEIVSTNWIFVLLLLQTNLDAKSDVSCVTIIMPVACSGKKRNFRLWVEFASALALRWMVTFLDNHRDEAACRNQCTYTNDCYVTLCIMCSCVNHHLLIEYLPSLLCI